MKYHPNIYCTSTTRILHRWKWKFFALTMREDGMKEILIVTVNRAHKAPKKWNVILIQVFIVVRLCIQLWYAIQQWHGEYRRKFKLKVTITNMYSWSYNLLKYTNMWQPMYIEAYRRKGSANNFWIQNTRHTYKHEQYQKQTETKTQVDVRYMHMEY